MYEVSHWWWYPLSIRCSLFVSCSSLTQRLFVADPASTNQWQSYHAIWSTPCLNVQNVKMNAKHCLIKIILRVQNCFSGGFFESFLAIERRDVSLYWKGNADWWTIFPAQTIISPISGITDPQTRSFTFWQGYFNVINFGGNMADVPSNWNSFSSADCTNKQEWFVFILI